MLSKRDNLLATIQGREADRYVKRYEAFFPLQFGDPVSVTYGTAPAEYQFTIPYGPITMEMAPGSPGPMPLEGPGITVIEDPDDIENWRDHVKVPDLSKIPEESFGPWDGLAAQCDREEQLLTLMTFPGLLDHIHFMMGMEEGMVAILAEPDAVREMVEQYVDYLSEYISIVVGRYGIEAVHEHDDWGSKRSTLISTDSFDEIFLEPYKRLHAAYRKAGVKVIIHHSDTYAATLVPELIEMDTDIWQGCLTSNDLPALLREYGEDITFMGGIDSDVVDVPGVDPELVRSKVDEICHAMGTKHFIPCTTMGGPNCIFPEVDPLVDAEIDRMSAELFG